MDRNLQERLSCSRRSPSGLPPQVRFGQATTAAVVRAVPLAWTLMAVRARRRRCGPFSSARTDAALPPPPARGDRPSPGNSYPAPGKPYVQPSRSARSALRRGTVRGLHLRTPMRDIHDDKPSIAITGGAGLIGSRAVRGFLPEYRSSSSTPPPGRKAAHHVLRSPRARRRAADLKSRRGGS